MRSAKSAMAAMAMTLLFGLAGCGGGGDGGDSGTPSSTTTTTTTTTTSPTTLVGVFIDAPVDGLLYSAQPSGLSGTTSNGGQYKYQPGDTVTFSIANGGNPIVLGSRVHGTGSVATNTFVSAMANGQQIAELLHALNHGSDSVLDVGGVTVSATVLAEIRAYLASAGATLSGQASDDQFLRHVQDNATTPGKFVHQVAGANNQFLVTVVLPDIQKSVAANPGPATSDGKAYHLSGSIVGNATSITQSGPTCSPSTITTTANSGAILNVTVNGDIQKSGTYSAQVASGTFFAVAQQTSATCTLPDGSKFVMGGQSASAPSPAVQVTSTIVSDGTNLTVTNLMANPAGCTGFDRLTGTVIGASNPMVTLGGAFSCDLGGGVSVSGTLSVKLVGSI